jgi:hypothetical protein
MRPFKDAGEDARITAGRETGATAEPSFHYCDGQGFERGFAALIDFQKNNLERLRHG